MYQWQVVYQNEDVWQHYNILTLLHNCINLWLYWCIDLSQAWIFYKKMLQVDCYQIFLHKVLNLHVYQNLKTRTSNNSCFLSSFVSTRIIVSKMFSAFNVGRKFKFCVTIHLELNLCVGDDGNNNVDCIYQGRVKIIN